MTAMVDGMKVGNAWLLTCRLCGPLCVATTYDIAQAEARAHLDTQHETREPVE
jgi:hypothetical protein